MTSWLVAFVMINNVWVFGPTLKGWEATEVGDPRLCSDGAQVLNTYPMPYTDYYKRRIERIKAFCLILEQ